MKTVLCRKCGINETKNRTGECKVCRKPTYDSSERPTSEQCAAFYEWAEPQEIELTQESFKRWLKEIGYGPELPGESGGTFRFTLPCSELPSDHSQRSGVLCELPTETDTATETGGESDMPATRLTDTGTRSTKTHTRSKGIGCQGRSVSKTIRPHLSGIVKRIEETEAYPWIVSPKTLHDLVYGSVMSEWNWGMCKFQPLRDVVVAVGTCGYSVGDIGIVMACKRERNGLVMCRVHFGGSRYEWIPESKLNERTEHV